MNEMEGARMIKAQIEKIDDYEGVMF